MWLRGRTVRAWVAIIGASLVALVGLWGATQFIAAAFGGQPALGQPLFSVGTPYYAPWAVLEWSARWGEAYPKPFAIARLIVLAGFVLAFIGAALVIRRRLTLPQFGRHAWAKFPDVEAAGLFAPHGTVLGKFDGEIMAFDGPEHQVLIGASRSGKGRGQVVPTLLTWTGSILVLDVKGELDRGDPRHGFPGTSGFRAELGRVFRLAPTDPTSHCFNPFFEVRIGPNEIRDIQNIVEALVHPHGETRGAELFWNNKGKDVITGVIVHVLYAEPVERKTLAIVREKLRDLDRTAEEMRTTLHRLNPTTGQPEVHPEVLHAAESYLSSEERLRSGIKATAESSFGMFADPIVAEKTSRSDFRIGDLMCCDEPVTLYLQLPPSDGPRLMPFVRLFINLTARALMEDQTRDTRGRKKKHRLLMLLDEFPQLGRLDFFEKMMAAMASYGIKVAMVCQSLNHIIKAYGRENVILDNAHIVTCYSASDPETAKRISDMAGEVWEVRPHESEQRPRALFGPRKGSITYREERRPLMLPAEVRALPRDEQLIFVAGAKPIRAKKLRFDQEPIFAERLRPPAPRAEGLTPAHDWENVRALGRTAPDPKPRASVKTERRASPRPAPSTPQTDLFASPPTSQPPAPATAKISEIALAGLRSRQAPPGPQDSEPPKRARATGV
jgi:type IV secretion system protein VirD4